MVPDMMPPNYLYHYTSLEALALILKNRSIRFCALDRVDDLHEGIAADLQSIGQWFLVSCWTDDPTESIPLWHMYSSQMKGVRIRLRAFPFADEHYQTNEEYSFFPNVATYEGEQLDFILAYPKEKLFRVEYGSQLDLRLFRKQGQATYDFRVEDIGKFKLQEWSFQNEWRYKMFILPKELVSFHEKGFKSEEDAFKELRKIYSRTKGLVRYHELEIARSAIDEIEILTGPRCDDAEYEIIESLISRHAPKAIVTKSKLQIRKPD